jgi:hypothetical protein
MHDQEKGGPDEVEPLAAEILEALRDSPVAGEIVLGGYFVLREYADYRTTHDLDAWWKSGAPRDFLDIHEIVTRGTVSVEQCWDWWSRKNPGIDLRQARAQALHHLEALEQRRPLESIENARARENARRTREWIRRTLLGVPADFGEGM